MILISIFALTLAGCASHQPSAVSDHPLTDSQGSISASQPRYSPSPAAVLAFDPPALAGSPRLDLSREDRGPAAFAGFEDESTTFFYLRVDDWFSDNLHGSSLPSRDQYQRRSVSETYGTSHH